MLHASPPCPSENALIALAGLEHAHIMSKARLSLSDEEVVALVRKTLDQAREDTTRRSEPGVAKDIIRPGITINLGHHGLRRLPEDAVDIFKADIERLALSHNSMTTLPPRMAECVRLRYLNVRYNALRDFPLAILQLSTLEILDVSKNKIRDIPEGIANLTSLKVLAIQRNRIERLPLCLGDISSLQMLKLDGNPVVFPPPEVCNIKDKTSVPTGDNERDALITNHVKRYLRQIATRERLRVESEGDSSEGNLETPRLTRSKGGGGGSGGSGGRFPVKPSISSIDAFGNLRPTSESPNTPAPPIPARSHYRVQSQHTAARRRPPVCPLVVNGNERNRSRSEGAGAVSLRSKRMGIVTRKTTTELAPVSEGLANALVHVCGSSQASALPEIESLDGSATSSVHRRPRLSSIRLLPGLAEPKRWSSDYDDIVQACRLLAESALDFLSPTGRLLRRVNLPSQNFLMTQFQKARASTYALSELINRFDTLTHDLESETHNLFIKLLDESQACIGLLVDLEIDIGDSEQHVGRVVEDRGVRSAWRAQINAQYMGAVEARNACQLLGVQFVEPPKADRRHARPCITPTQTIPRPEQRRQATKPLMMMMTIDTNARNDRLAWDSAQLSNSNTTPGVHFPMSRTDTMTSTDGADEEQIFERILQRLKHACASTLQSLPVCHERFIHALNTDQDDGERGHMAYSNTWLRVLERSSEAHQAATSLNEVLRTVKPSDAELRGSQRFWELCTTWVKAWSDLAVAVRQLGDLVHLPDDIKHIMKPVQKAVKEAGGAITNSPWCHLAVRNEPSAMSAPQPAMPVRPTDGHKPGHGFNATSISVHSNHSHSTVIPSSLGFATPVPATPLSAALGAAAQAIVPSTPGNASSVFTPPVFTPPDPPMTGRFAGNVFERADRLLQQTQRRI